MNMMMDRRRLLTGLAAASTAAAVPAVAAQPSENSELLRLADQFPALVADYHEAIEAREWLLAEWKHRWPLAPDEITNGRALLRPELDLGGKPIVRNGEDHPRDVWSVADLEENLVFHQRPSRKGTSEKTLAHRARYRRQAEEQLDIGRRYWAEADRVREASGIKAADLRIKNARRAMVDRVSSIMGHEVVTIEGVMVKAQTFDAWQKAAPTFAAIMASEASEWLAQLTADLVRLSAANGMEA